MARKIIIGLIITLILLAVARRLSMNRPEDLKSVSGGVTLTHRSVFEQVGEGNPILGLNISFSPDGEEDITADVVYRESARSETERIGMARTGPGTWLAELPQRDKGNSLEYAFEVDTGGGRKIRLPEGSRFLRLKYKGEVSLFVLIFHVIFMFGAFFFMVEAVMESIPVLRGTGDRKNLVSMIRWLMIFTFIGGFPLGFILNQQRFGVIWEGFPFGYDVTDNKTQLMFLFWLITVLLSWGSFTGNRKLRDRLSERGLAAAVIISFVLSLAVFLIPHSL